MNYTATDNPQRFTTLPAGIYEAELLEFEDNLTSKKGNEMSKLNIKVYGEFETRIFDYLVNMDSMQWKIKSFMEAVGQVYGQPIDFEGAKGKLFNVKVVESTYEGKAQNKIDEYFVYSGSQSFTAPQLQPTDSAIGSKIPDSDLPF